MQTKGMLNDHEGKRSNSRAASMLGALGLFLATVGAMAGANEPSPYLIGALVALAIGPIGFNRWLGEKGNPSDGQT